MLTKCPRCGFTQPIDHYCAQCGVDMETYRPPKSHLGKRIFTHPLFQVSIVVVIAVTVLQFILTQQNSSIQNQISQQINQVQKTLRVNSPAKQEDVSGAVGSADRAAAGTNTTLSGSSTPPLPGATNGSLESTSMASAGPAVGGATNPTSSNTTSNVNKNSNAADIKSTTATAQESSNYKARIYYLEVSKRMYEVITEESQGTGQYNQFGDHAAGLVLNASKLIGPTNAKEIKVLHKENFNVDPTHRTHQWSLGLKNHDFLFESVLELTDVENNNFKVNFETKRYQRDQVSSYPLIFEINLESGFFISGLMPRKLPPEIEKQLGQQNIFKILDSASFRTGESEFMILIEFDTH